MSSNIFYGDYFTEYFQEAYDEMEEYLESRDDPTDKTGVYKENYIFRDSILIPKVTKVLAKHSTQEAIIEYTGRFIDNHQQALSAPGPIYTWTLGQKEIMPIYELFDVSPDLILETYERVVKETYFGKISSFFTGWIKNAPHKILITAILIDSLQNGYEDVCTCCKLLLAFIEYPILYKKSWKLGVKPDLMKYTIERLGSKFKIKQFKKIQDLLEYDASCSVAACKSALLKGADNAYLDFLYRLRNQIRNKIVNIAKEYFNNDLKNASQHSIDSQFADGSLNDQEGHTTITAQVIDKTMSKFSIGSINTSMIRVSADENQVDKDILAGYINQISAVKDNRIGRLVELIITIYFNKYPTNTQIMSSEFLTFGIALYRSIGTSKDEFYQEIRTILNHWMFDIINIQEFYKREGTIIAYTKAIFQYFILMIIYYN